MNTDVPTQFLPCIATPIYKKKDSRTLPSSYRSILVSSSFCKCLEGILNRSLLSYLHSYDIIPSTQYGFRPKRSTTALLCNAFTDFSAAIDEGRTIYCALLDFSNAFAAPSFDRILAKMENVGIRGRELDWFADFIANRTFTVKIGDVLSDSFPIQAGVTQGSPSSSTIWLIFMRDLQLRIESLGCKGLYYADDCSLYTEDPDILSAAIAETIQFCKEWTIDLSISKSVIVIYGNAPDPIPVFQINGIPIPTETGPTKILGVQVRPDLSFVDHVNAIVAKANSTCALIFRTFSTRDPVVYARAFISFVRPVLEFSSPAWNAINITDCDRIERVQRLFTLRVIRRCNLKKRSYIDRLAICQLEPLRLRRRLIDVGFVHSVLQEGHFCPAITPIPPNPAYPLRDSLRLPVPKKCSKFLASSFKVRVSRLWNAIPLKTRRLGKSAFNARARACRN